MKFLQTIFCFAFFVSPIIAQENTDEAIIRCYYRFTQKKKTGDKEIILQDTLTLDIGSQMSRYYDERKIQRDSIFSGILPNLDASRIKSISIFKDQEQGSFQSMLGDTYQNDTYDGVSEQIFKNRKTVARKSQTVDFVVDFELITLQEVKITLPKISQKGDTLSYTVSSFMDNNDRTIGDVLKKLPGIEVKESGQILYQNIPINKFYIEGLDLLQGRYGIATQNIEAKDVLNVEVLENHQEIRLLRDKIISTQAAINLKLKESTKGVWTANALLGAGISPAHWAGELTAMYFAKNTQNISTYKGNNTGNDVSGEQGMLYTMESFQQPDDRLLSLQAPSPPSISSKRYLFNDVNGLSFNNLWKTSKDYQINANAQYLNDRIDKSSFNRTVYYLLRDYMGVEETLESQSYINQANADIQLNINKDKFYLNNRLQLKGGWDNEHGNAIRGDTVRQQLDKPDYGVFVPICVIWIRI